MSQEITTTIKVNRISDLNGVPVLDNGSEKRRITLEEGDSVCPFCDQIFAIDEEIITVGDPCWSCKVKVSSIEIKSTEDDGDVNSTK